MKQPRTEPGGSQYILLTTIFPPTAAVRQMAARAARLPSKLVIVGDAKTPEPYSLRGAAYLSLLSQKATGFRLAALAPTGHYSRKNIGYLIAIREKASRILETDDDNFPKPSFGTRRRLSLSVPCLDWPGAVNIYSYFTHDHCWPRGLPLAAINRATPAFSSLPRPILDCPIQNGLVDEDPDVDALFRLILARPIRFRKRRSVALAKGTWCPFNSQNTLWWPPAYPLLYLPSTCPFRMTDIWRSYIAQRICWEAGWNLLFHSPTVSQKRNRHDLLQDFEDELPGYRHSHSVIALLEDLPLRAGAHAVVDNLVRCYEALVARKYIHRKELTYLKAWIGDLQSLNIL